MALIPLERLIDGCMQTLREEVLPEVASRAVRGRVFAVLDVLNNMRDRIEEKAAPAAAEADSAAAALLAFAAALRAGSDAAGATALENAVAALPKEPAAVRATGLRALLAGAIAARPQGLSQAERDALRTHLSGQALRDVMLLKPSLLSEISKG
jgi:hypothetical protein